MKITPPVTAIFFVTLLSAGLVSVARWFHPATFSISVLWLLLVIAFTSAAVLILHND